MATTDAVGETQGIAQPQADTEGKRERSTIAFPYLDLDDAVEVAKGVHSAGGASCRTEQLAGHLKQAVDNSMFQLRLNTARIFGLVTYGKGTVALTPLGSRVCDPQQEKTARAESFLAVALYKAVYDKFKGATLPPPAGLESAMVGMGVSEKQKEKARRVFQRSAQEGGFFQFGQDRLVYPTTKGGSESGSNGESDTRQEEPEKKSRKEGDGGDGDGENPSRHPLIEGLIKTLRNLPTEQKAWPIESQRKWLQTAANIFDMVYPVEPGSSLRIEIHKDSAK